MLYLTVTMVCSGRSDQLQGIVLLVSLRVLEVRPGVPDVRYLEDW